MQGITDLMTNNPYIHVDFSDVTTILRGAGTALFGIGSARGEDRATQAAEIAISSPLLEESIEGAQGALVNIAGPTDLKLLEASHAVELVKKAIHPEAQIIWGLSLDDAYGDEVRVTVIAAGFDKAGKEAADAGAPAAAQPLATNAQPAQQAATPAAQPQQAQPASGNLIDAGAQNPASPAPERPAAAPYVAPQQNPAAGNYGYGNYGQYGDDGDATTEHRVVPSNDPGDLDIPDFLR